MDRSLGEMRVLRADGLRAAACASWSRIAVARARGCPIRSARAARVDRGRRRALGTGRRLRPAVGLWRRAATGASDGTRTAWCRRREDVKTLAQPVDRTEIAQRL